MGSERPRTQRHKFDHSVSRDEGKPGTRVAEKAKADMGKAEL